MKQINKYLFLVLAFLPCGTFFAYAADKNNELPINISSVESSYDPNKETVIYKTDVIATQGSLEIKADIVTFYLKESELDYLEAHGKPIKIKYLPEGKDVWVYGEGLILKYFPQKNHLVLEENAKVTQLEDTIDADRIEYNTVTEIVSAHSNKNRRIKMTVQPKKGDK